MNIYDVADWMFWVYVKPFLTDIWDEDGSGGGVG